MEKEEKTTIGPFEMEILATIKTLNQNAFGKEIERHLNLIFDKKTASGAIYSSLARLKEKEVISSEITFPAKKKKGSRRRVVYSITPEGFEIIKQEVCRLKKVCKILV